MTPPVRSHTRWSNRGRPYDRLMVLPPLWEPRKPERRYFPDTVGKKLCMMEGYEQKLVWLSNEEIRDEWKPWHFKTDLSYLPLWVKPKALATWHVNDKRTMDIEVYQVNRRIGAITVLYQHPLVGVEAIESVGGRVGRFFWCESRYTCFFCDTKTFNQNVTTRYPPKPTIWDRIRAGGAFAV